MSEGTAFIQKGNKGKKNKDKDDDKGKEPFKYNKELSWANFDRVKMIPGLRRYNNIYVVEEDKIIMSLF